MQDLDKKEVGQPADPADVEKEPFLIDPGNEDPGAGIDQPLPEPASEPPAH